MMTIYDMNTGQIIETGKRKTATVDALEPERRQQLEERLQLVVSSSQEHTKSGMPLDLINVDLDMYLQQMR